MATGRYHWSNAAFKARFAWIDAVAAVPLLAVIVFPSWGTAYFAVGTVVFLVFVEKYLKLSIAAFFRSINIFFTGRLKTTLNIFKELNR